MLCDPFAFTLTFVPFVFSFCADFKVTLAFLHLFFVCFVYSHKIMYEISQEGFEKKSIENLHRFYLNGMLPLTFHLIYKKLVSLSFGHFFMQEIQGLSCQKTQDLK